eukprot:scaffold16407_cov127-Isochrysis_galbana.AAC.4
MSLLLCATAVSAYTLSPMGLQTRALQTSREEARVAADAQMSLAIDLKGKTVFVAGVADSTGYGWAICKVSTAVAVLSKGLQVATSGLPLPERRFGSASAQLYTWRSCSVALTLRRSPTPVPPSPLGRGRPCWASSRNRCPRASSMMT